MSELIFGTSNPAKISQVQGALLPVDVTVRGIGDFGIELDVPEDGPTAADNARVKALAYAKELGQSVFSMDNGLYLDGLADDEQPGIYVRRIPGSTERPTDEEMIQYYTDLIAGHGGQMEGHWDFAVAIATAAGDVHETVIQSPRYFTATRSPKVIDGYPLESIQIDPESGKYISEMSTEEQDAFWQKAIGEPLAEFVQDFLTR